MARNGRREYLRRNKHRIKRNQMQRDWNIKAIVATVGRFLLATLITVVFAYSLVQFGGQTLCVIGQSMEPTLSNGEEVFVNKAVYLLGDIKRYDIVAFKLRNGDNSYYTIKRVIGLPGDTISIVDGTVLVNGIVLKDMPIQEKILTEGMAAKEIQLSQGEYFVLGDNVNNSEDSRFVNMGNILENEILGKVTYRINPKEQRGKIK